MGLLKTSDPDNRVREKEERKREVLGNVERGNTTSQIEQNRNEKPKKNEKKKKKKKRRRSREEEKYYIVIIVEVKERGGGEEGKGCEI